VWVTSTLGRVLPGRGGLYPATKWAAEGFAESLHHQVAPFGIDVVILEPGSFPTPATSKSMEAEEASVVSAYASVAPPPRGSRPIDPAYRAPEPQDVADAALELVEAPAGERPLRRVRGPVLTAGGAQHYPSHERSRAARE